MEPQVFRVTDPAEALAVEQALAMVRELKQVCQTAPHGQVLAHVELLAVARGREFARKGMEAVLNQQAQEVEKRGRRAGPVPAEGAAPTEDATGGRS